MPEQNRDRETLYSMPKLNAAFLAASGLLVVGVLWMLAGDFARPWKDVQRDYFRRQAGLLAVEREQAQAALASSESAAAELRDLGAKIAAERAAAEAPAFAAETARLRAQFAERNARLAEAEREIKAVKGAYSEKVYQIEMARKAGDAARADALLGEVRALGDRRDEWERRRLEELAAHDELESALERRQAPLAALLARRDALLADVAKAGRALEDARAKTEEARWRNLPLAEIVSPTIKIEKVVLDSIHDDYNFATSPKVDMCVTCHRGADREIMSEGKVGPLLAAYLRSRLGESAWEKLEAEEGWRRLSAPGSLRPWLSGAPGLADAFPPAALEAALGGPEAAARWRERWLSGKSFEEGGRDLLAPFAIRPVEWAHPHLELMVGSSSPHPISRVGCTTCHQGVGRRLEFSRAAHTPEGHEEEARWRAEHDWREPEFVLYPMVPGRHVEGQCLKCHLPGLEYPAVPEPLVRWEEKRGSDGKVERSRAKAPMPVDSASTGAVDGRWRPERLERGMALTQEMGCTGCHLVKDFGRNPGYPRPAGAGGGPDLAAPAPGALQASGEPKVGPDLTHLRDKTTREWAARWIEIPTAYRIDTRMPAFYRHRLRDDKWNVLPGPDGRPQDETVVLQPTGRDLAQIEVETLALATYLVDGQTGSRAAQYPEPPAGDPQKGRELFYSVGCYACHVGPDDHAGSGLPEATLRRFERRDALPPGPRLTAMGSKVTAKWLYAWLAEPRHYNSVTRMPNLRWHDQTAPDGKTVVRSADQLRADVVAYLMQARDPAFEAMPVPDPARGVRWTKEHELLLKDFWVEWYGKTKADPADPSRRATMTAEEASAEASRLYRDDAGRMLADVGRRLVGYRGCFGCHNVQGFEDEQPIGKELTNEGSQDVHKFDFGIIDHHEVPHTRWDWIENKLRQPRLYDRGLFKPRWGDKLRMPKFNLREEDRIAVVTTILGLVKEPIRPEAKYAPDDRMAKIANGRAVIARYSCNQCHTIENRLGVLTGEQLDRGLEIWMLPPNLHGQGNRTKADWLFRFLKAPFDVRPGVIQRMPLFRLSDEEVAALVDYFQAVSGRADRFDTDALDAPLDPTPYPEPVKIVVKTKDAEGNAVDREILVRDRIEETKALFETVNCVKCHLPKGTPGADPAEGSSAPPFTLARERLRRAWMFDMVHEPQWQIQGTKMPAFWPAKARRAQKPGDTRRVEFPQFLCDARGREGLTPDQIGEAQMGSIVRWILHHYVSPTFAAPKAAPAGEGK